MYFSGLTDLKWRSEDEIPEFIQTAGAVVGDVAGIVDVLKGNLQSYWTTTKLWKLTVVLDYYEAKETCSRIGLLRSYGNLQS